MLGGLFNVWARETEKRITFPLRGRRLPDRTDPCELRAADLAGISGYNGVGNALAAMGTFKSHAAKIAARLVKLASGSWRTSNTLLEHYRPEGPRGLVTAGALGKP